MAAPGRCGGRATLTPMSLPEPHPTEPAREFQRLAAYAVVLRQAADGAAEVLLSRLAPHLAPHEQWTLPGGGVEHGEDPAHAVVREVMEETGLAVTVGEDVRVHSQYFGEVARDGEQVDAHAVRLVYRGWVPRSAPEPHTVEVDGSTVDAGWHRVDDVLAGRLKVTGVVGAGLEGVMPHRLQRLAAYGLARRGEEVLLTRISPRGHHVGAWTLPGGGVDHGEPPAVALRREVAEECGVVGEVGRVLTVHDVHFTGTSPVGRLEDFHGVHLVYRLTLPTDADPRVTEEGGTTDAVAWVPLAQILDGTVPVLDVVRAALAAS